MLCSLTTTRARYIHVSLRNFGKARNRERQLAYQAKMVKATEELNDAPKFSNLIRQMYRKSHPDLLRASHLEQSQVNDKSMQILNNVLTTIKQYNEFPPSIVKDIPFYMKVNGSSDLSPVHLNIRTAGGDCKRQITRTFEQFFVDAGISAEGKFNWDKEYFPTSETGEVEEEQKM